MKKSVIRVMVREEIENIREAGYQESLVKMVKELESKLKRHKFDSKEEEKQAQDALAQLNAVLDMK